MGNRNSSKSLRKNKPELYWSNEFIGLIISDTIDDLYKKNEPLTESPTFIFFNSQSNVIIDFSNLNDEDFNKIKNFFSEMSSNTSFNIINESANYLDERGERIEADLAGSYTFTKIRGKLVEAEISSLNDLNSRNDTYDSKFFLGIPEFNTSDVSVSTDELYQIKNHSSLTSEFSFKNSGGVIPGDLIELNTTNNKGRFEVTDYYTKSGIEHITISSSTKINEEELVGTLTFVSVYRTGWNERSLSSPEKLDLSVLRKSTNVSDKENGTCCLFTKNTFEDIDTGHTFVEGDLYSCSCLMDWECISLAHRTNKDFKFIKKNIDNCNGHAVFLGSPNNSTENYCTECTPSFESENTILEETRNQPDDIINQQSSENINQNINPQNQSSTVVYKGKQNKTKRVSFGERPNSKNIKSTKIKSTPFRKTLISSATIPCNTIEDAYNSSRTCCSPSCSECLDKAIRKVESPSGDGEINPNIGCDVINKNDPSTSHMRCYKNVTGQELCNSIIPKTDPYWNEYIDIKCGKVTMKGKRKEFCWACGPYQIKFGAWSDVEKFSTCRVCTTLKNYDWAQDMCFSNSGCEKKEELSKLILACYRRKYTRVLDCQCKGGCTDSSGTLRECHDPCTVSSGNIDCGGKQTCLTCEQLARLHNGGPGWCSQPTGTDGYWNKIKNAMRQICPDIAEECINCSGTGRGACCFGGTCVTVANEKACKEKLFSDSVDYKFFPNWSCSQLKAYVRENSDTDGWCDCCGVDPGIGPFPPCPADVPCGYDSTKEEHCDNKWCYKVFGSDPACCRCSSSHSARMNAAGSPNGGCPTGNPPVDPQPNILSALLLETSTPPYNDTLGEGPFAIEGFFPLYKTKDSSDGASPDKSGSHSHIINENKYYMPRGLLMGANQFHGDFTEQDSHYTDGPFSIDGHYPLYRTKSLAESASPNNTGSHGKTIKEILYYIPNGRTE